MKRQWIGRSIVTRVRSERIRFPGLKKPEWISDVSNLLMAANYQCLIGIDPSGKDDQVVANMPMVASKTIFAKPLWPAGVLADRYQAYGAAEYLGWNNMDAPVFEIKGLKKMRSERSLCTTAIQIWSVPRLSAVILKKIGPNEIQVQPAGAIEGRLLDTEGVPVTDATLYMGNAFTNDLSVGMWAPHPGKIRNPSAIPTDQDGRFKLDWDCSRNEVHSLCHCAQESSIPKG